MANQSTHLRRSGGRFVNGQSGYPSGRPKGSTGHAAELRRLEEAALILAGIYYGVQYGRYTTAFLLKMPGESASVVTCLDGYAMARQGRAGPALAIAALGSFFAGCVATLVIVLFSPPLVQVTLTFGSAEYFSLMVLGLVSAVVLAHSSVLKAVAMVFVEEER